MTPTSTDVGHTVGLTHSTMAPLVLKIIKLFSKTQNRVGFDPAVNRPLVRSTLLFSVPGLILATL